MTPVALTAQKTRLRVQGVGQFLGHSMDAVLAIAVSVGSHGEAMEEKYIYIFICIYNIIDHYCQCGSIWFLLQIPSHRVRVTCLAQKITKDAKGIEKDLASSRCKAAQEHHAAGNSYAP